MLINSPKYGKFYAKIDLNDVDKCREYRWHIRKCNKQNYDCFYVGTIANGKTILLHRFILNDPHGKDVDHINRNGLDNRRNNLRTCNDSTNRMNTKLYISNSSGHKGVCWSKKQNKWIAYIAIDWKHKTLGYFEDLNDAIRCREEAEIKYFGSYRAKLN